MTTSEDSRAARTKRHVTRHKTKYSLAIGGACILEVLNIVGALGPIICNLPFVPVESRTMCLASFGAAEKASGAAMKLDEGHLDEAAVSDEAAPIPTITVEQ